MNVDYINDLRKREIDMVKTRYREILEGKIVLEIGSGTGAQLVELSELASEVVGIDLELGSYHQHADPRVRSYDGHNIPFSDNSFDVIFSSNVLEHIAHRDAFQDEIFRVLKPGGYCIHLLPSHYWRLWTSVGTFIVFPARLSVGVASYLRTGKWELAHDLSRWLDLIVGDRHGEFGNRITEFYHFRPSVWRRYFDQKGWSVVEMRPGGLAYEGNMILAHSIRWSPDSPLTRAIAEPSWKMRSKMSRVFGSSCYVFLLRAPEETEK